MKINFQNNKWIATFIWFSLLIALVYTSGYGTFSIFGGSIASFLRNILLEAMNYPARGLLTIPTTSLSLLTIAVIFFLFNAWRKFVILTTEMLVSFSESKDGENASIFEDFLLFDLTEDNTDIEQESTPQEARDISNYDAEGSMVGDVVKYLGFSWMAMVASLPVVTAIGIIFGT